MAISIIGKSQDILIYHGLKGTSAIVEGSSNRLSYQSYKFKKGEKVTVQVVNAHPALYKYEFTNKETEIEDPEFPDFFQLVASLSGESGLQIESAEKARIEISGGDSIIAEDSGKWQNRYKLKIDKFKQWISDAEKIIAASDFPQSVEKAMDHSYDGGFLGAKFMLSQNQLFTIGDIDEYVEKWQKEVKSPDAPYYYKPEDDMKSELLMELYDNYLKTLSVRAREIRNSYNSEVCNTFSYSLTVGDKIANLTLKITPKNDKLKNREVGDSVIAIEIIPYYDRPVIELVPVAIMSHSS